MPQPGGVGRLITLFLLVFFKLLLGTASGKLASSKCHSASALALYYDFKASVISELHVKTRISGRSTRARCNTRTTRRSRNRYHEQTSAQRSL
ncbi:hypothetical protein PAXRUDRAFT_822360 [Paxillus rubicundulus Ve08.2h10]|uniref:Secreted protein n=1 Tax=Paxillus rubicundulus Ve08.2h10 TaxID=930991 RepID=A0A0D0ECR3_9AGAM|nr:hypothetical protein PAXRUDRAFT_822360 [Paxillus rubicundulus Ve08.2h10]